MIYYKTVAGCPLTSPSWCRGLSCNRSISKTFILKTWIYIAHWLLESDLHVTGCESALVTRAWDKSQSQLILTGSVNKIRTFHLCLIFQPPPGLNSAWSSQCSWGWGSSRRTCTRTFLRNGNTVWCQIKMIKCILCAMHCFYRGACRNFKKSMIVDNNLDLILSFGSSLQLCVKCFNFSTPKPSWCVLKALHQLLERVWQIQNKNSGKSNLENALQRTDKLEARELTNWRRS